MNDKQLQELTQMHESLEKQLLKNKEPETLTDRMMDYLGQFIAYALIIMLMWVCWNFALVPVFPAVPATTIFQMAGIWYLSAVLLKRA